MLSSWCKELGRIFSIFFVLLLIILFKLNIAICNLQVFLITGEWNVFGFIQILINLTYSSLKFSGKNKIEHNIVIIFFTSVLNSNWWTIC